MKICPLFYATHDKSQRSPGETHIGRQIARLEAAECLYRDCQWYVMATETCAVFQILEVLKEISSQMPGEGE
jgi:hypothetical protein